MDGPPEEYTRPSAAGEVLAVRLVIRGPHVEIVILSVVLMLPVLALCSSRSASGVAGVSSAWEPRAHPPVATSVRSQQCERTT